MDKTIKVWNTATGEDLLTLRSDDASLLSMAISPGGKTIAAAGRDGIVRFWDTGPPGAAPAARPRQRSPAGASSRASTGGACRFGTKRTWPPSSN